MACKCLLTMLIHVRLSIATVESCRWLSQQHQKQERAIIIVGCFIVIVDRFNVMFLLWNVVKFLLKAIPHVIDFIVYRIQISSFRPSSIYVLFDLYIIGSVSYKALPILSNLHWNINMSSSSCATVSIIIVWCSFWIFAQAPTMRHMCYQAGISCDCFSTPSRHFLSPFCRQLYLTLSCKFPLQLIPFLWIQWFLYIHEYSPNIFCGIILNGHIPQHSVDFIYLCQQKEIRYCSLNIAEMISIPQRHHSLQQ